MIASSRSNGGLLADRGFKEARCYSLPAIRKCTKAAEFSCVLQIFPLTSGQLTFDLNTKRDSLKQETPSVDYGIFTFKMISEMPEKAPEIKILMVKRIPLDKWDSVQTKSFQAEETLCPK